MAIFLVVILIAACFRQALQCPPTCCMVSNAFRNLPGTYYAGVASSSEAITTPPGPFAARFSLLGDLTVNGHPSGQWHLHVEWSMTPPPRRSL